jgi:hypothetical protein
MRSDRHTSYLVGAHTARLWGLCCTLCLSSMASHASDEAARRFLQSQLGTISTAATPQFPDGKLYGCIIEYATVAQDWAYRQPSLGSVALSEL